MNIQPIPTTKNELMSALSQHPVNLGQTIRQAVDAEAAFELAKRELKTIESKVGMQSRTRLAKPTEAAVSELVDTDTDVVKARQNLQDLENACRRAKADLEVMRSVERSMELMASLLGCEK